MQDMIGLGLAKNQVQEYQIGAYLIFVHFNTPPHYLGLLKVHRKVGNLQQNSLNWSKWAKILRSLG